MPVLTKTQLLYGDEISFWEDVYGLADNIFASHSKWSDLAKLCGRRILRKASAIQMDRKVWPILLHAFRFDLPRVDFLLKKYPPNFAGFATDRQFIAEELWDFLLDYGDDQSIALWQKKLESLELLAPYMLRPKAVYLAAKKRDFVAAAELRSHFTGKDDFHYPMLDALLASATRDKRKAETAIAKLDVQTSPHRFTKLLCNAILNKEGSDEAIRRLVAESKSWYRYFVTVAVYSEAHKSVHKKFDEKLWTQLYEFAASYPTANTKEWYFGKEANIARYSGTTKFPVIPFEDDGKVGKGGDLTMNCLPGGEVNGTYEEEGGAIGVLAGTYDKFGNLVATLRISGHELQIIAKLLPNELPAGMKELPAQEFTVLDEAASMVHWYGNTTKTH